MRLGFALALPLALGGCDRPSEVRWSAITLGGIPVGTERVEVWPDGADRRVVRDRSWRMRLGEAVLDHDVRTVTGLHADGSVAWAERDGGVRTFPQGAIDPEFSPEVLRGARHGPVDVAVHLSATDEVVRLHLVPDGEDVLAGNARLSMRWTVLPTGELSRVAAGALVVSRVPGPVPIPRSADISGALGWPVPAMPGARAAHRLVVRVTGIDAARFERPGQTVAGDAVTVSTPLRAEVPARASEIPADLAPFLAAEPGIPSDDPDLRALAAGVADPDQRARLSALVRLVGERLAVGPSLAVPDAAAALRAGVGDCNEHAVLLVALARAAGLPARSLHGLVYLDDGLPPGFYPHAWAEVYVGEPVGWVPVDPVLGQPIADATHLALADRDDLAGLLGREHGARMDVVTVW